MYSVDHLVARHQRQMERLAKQQEKSARRRTRQQERLEAAFQTFKIELSASVERATARKAGMPVKRAGQAGLMTMLRSFLL